MTVTESISIFILLRILLPGKSRPNAITFNGHAPSAPSTYYYHGQCRKADEENSAIKPIMSVTRTLIANVPISSSVGGKW
jgi:hypothetical protein